MRKEEENEAKKIKVEGKNEKKENVKLDKLEWLDKLIRC